MKPVFPCPFIIHKDARVDGVNPSAEKFGLMLGVFSESDAKSSRVGDSVGGDGNAIGGTGIAYGLSARCVQLLGVEGDRLSTEAIRVG